MKRIIVIAVLSLFATISYAQSFYTKGTLDTKDWTQKDSLQMHLLNRVNQKAAPGYKLYKTDNMYNFILLDTESGNVWQAQWSYDADKRGIVKIYEF